MVLNDTNRSLPKPLNKGKRLMYDKDKGKENRAPEEDEWLRTNSQVRKRKSTNIHIQHKKAKHDKIPINIPVAACSKDEEKYGSPEESIELISNRLKQNMTRATYNALASLFQSNRPQDVFVYEKVFCDHQHSVPAQTSDLSGHVDTPAFEKKQEFLRFDSTHFSKNLSFNSDQENDFINTWIQCHNEGKEPRALANQDSFSIVTEELSGYLFLYLIFIIAMLFTLLYSFTNLVLSSIFTTHLIPSLTAFLLSYFSLFDLSCLWILPWILVGCLVETVYVYHSASHTLPKTNKTFLQYPAETSKPPKRRRTTSHSSPTLNQKISRLCTRPELAPTAQPDDSDSGTEPESPVTPNHDPRRYYSLFFTGFDLAPVVSCGTDEVEMIHEHSVLNFLNQVDHEDNEFFSRHLDKHYALIL